MANAWDDAEELSKRDSGSGMFLKFKNDGDSAIVVFLGEPLVREVCFVNNKYIRFDEECRQNGLKPTFRYTLNVALHPTKDVKVMEVGRALFLDICNVRKKYGLDKWAFEIKRSGQPKDPKTTYKILPDAQLSDDERAQYKGLRLHDLGKLYVEDSVPF